MFKKVKYIIRLDDASPYSDLTKWKLIERILDKYNVKPIVAVVPKNEDQSIHYERFNDSFWRWVKSWELKGWSIALHGYKHLFHLVNRKKNLFHFYNRSEFTELSLKVQREKIKKGMAIFKKNKIEPKVWVAPGHCFDKNTLKALQLETKINIISDGIALNTFFKYNFHFIPQQLWDFKKKYFGLWTICLHPDTMSLKQIESLEEKIALLSIERKLISVQELHLEKKGERILDILFSFFFWRKYNLKIWLKLCFKNKA